MGGCEIVENFVQACAVPVSPTKNPPKSLWAPLHHLRLLHNLAPIPIHNGNLEARFSCKICREGVGLGMSKLFILPFFLFLSCGGNDDSSYIGEYLSGDGTIKLFLKEDKTAFMGGVNKMGTWKVRGGEILFTTVMVENPAESPSFILRIEEDGKLTTVAFESSKGRKDWPENNQVTYEKIE